jgi:shikimate kinase
MKNIFLIGFMGCGKSTIASCLSEKYGMAVVEMDEELVQREGMSIPNIFEKYGETYFRDAETKLVLDLQDREGQVVSCGGGVVLREENVVLMKKSGTIVFLTAKAETILARVKDDNNRPLLQGKKDVVSIQEMLNQRRPKYEKAADILVATDDRDAEEICKEILEKIGEEQ